LVGEFVGGIGSRPILQPTNAPTNATAKEALTIVSRDLILIFSP